MILGGDEWMRTQYGNNNAYLDAADNEFNWFSWSNWKPDQERQRMFDFVKNAIALRKSLAPRFSPDGYEEVEFLHPDGGAPDWHSRSVMMYWPQKGDLPAVVSLINMDIANEVTFKLPEVADGWQVAVDTQLYYDWSDYIGDKDNKRISYNINPQGDAVLESNNYGVKSRTIVILKQKQ